MNALDDSIAFVQRVRDAAQQLWLMHPWEYDRRLEAEEWTTLYAVDADVIIMYGSPYSIASRSGARLGYAEVFADDPPEGSVALAERLAEHIFFNQQKQPLLVIPPIDSELFSIFDALTARLGTEPEPIHIDTSAIKAAIQKIENVEGEEIPTDVLDQFARLVALGSRGPQTEYLRLTHLLELRRFVSAEWISNKDMFPRRVHRTLSAFNKLEEIYDYVVFSRDWLPA